MIRTKEKGGFFGKALAAACSVALVASLTPAAAVSAFAAEAQKAHETLTLTVQQLGSDGSVVKSASIKLNDEKAAKYMTSSSAKSVVYSTGQLNGDTGNFGVATITSASAATVSELVKNVKIEGSGNVFIESALGTTADKVDGLLKDATVTIKSGYTADAATLNNTGVITDFVQSVDMGWNELNISKNWYPNTTANKIVTTGQAPDAGAFIVTSGHTVFNAITGQPNTTKGTAAAVATLNQQQDEKDIALANKNGFTFITGVTANDANNHQFQATQNMVQGVSDIVITIPYPGLENTARVAGTNWDDTMIATIDAMIDAPKATAANKILAGKNIPTTKPSWLTTPNNTFVVATAGGYEDALAASGFAGLLECPLLMTDRNTLTASTKKYIEDNNTYDDDGNPITIYLIGGNMAVSDEVQAELEAINGVDNTTNGAVIRIAGENSWDTSLELYKKGIELGKTWGKGNANGAVDKSEVIVATSIDFQDALSISPYAYANKLPVILTTNNAVLSDNVAEAMQAAIKNVTATTKDPKAGNIEQATLVGGTVVVSPVVNNQLLNIPINRLAGTTAYDTSNAIAKYLTKDVNNFKNATVASMATGELYLDALSSCNFTGTQKTVLLLVNDAAENGTVCITDFLTQYGPNGTTPGKITKGVIFGGTVVVSEASEILADTALRTPTYKPLSL